MSTPQPKKILFFILRNLALCALLVSITFISADGDKSKDGYRHAFYVVIVTFYIWLVFHNTVLFGKLFLRRHYLYYFLSLAAGILLISRVHRGIMEPLARNSESWRGAIIGNLVYTCIGLACYLAFKYLLERKTFYQLKVMQRDIELQQLKSHLNPHFLFNALNNIYSYTLQHNRFGDELILKLSELMRFILDYSDKSEIRIMDELGFIRNYIVFERERLGERCLINFNMKEGDPDRQIAPLILFPFIENACKYGADTIQRTEIDITIENETNFLKMVVANNIVNRTTKSTKTGLQNAVRRLELLYPNRHEVLITTDNNRFIVELILQYED
ncbi:MAG: histidine kinase [Chitinophagaceae bacterium]|nr:histidine kinase [Chitinophagaceae bacterium]